MLSRPSAYFKSSKSSPYCLNQKLEPRSGHHDDPVIILTGKAPFKLTLNIKNVATSESRIAVVDVTTPEWKVDIPTYKLQTVGPHLITIESFEDSSPCSPSAVDYERRTFRVDVAETAAIVPFDRREDWCVGDILQFQLEGNAPWKIEFVSCVNCQCVHIPDSFSSSPTAIDSMGSQSLQTPRSRNSVGWQSNRAYSKSQGLHTSRLHVRARSRMLS